VYILRFTHRTGTKSSCKVRARLIVAREFTCTEIHVTSWLLERSVITREFGKSSEHEQDILHATCGQYEAVDRDLRSEMIAGQLVLIVQVRKRDLSP
jgi:hypothetical protein